MMTLYVKGKSKKALNEDILAGKAVYGENHSFFGNDSGMHKVQDCPTGTTIKVYEKYAQGSPYAKAYGTWNKEKNKII
jgi:hypothetical protein